MRAVKGNRVYTISEQEQRPYHDDGFDILSDNGQVIAYGRGKTVPYGDYAALKKENEGLKAEIASLRGQNEPAVEVGVEIDPKIVAEALKNQTKTASRKTGK